jgi:hypothetical protein
MTLTEKQKQFQKKMAKLLNKTSDFIEDYEKLQKINNKNGKRKESKN